MNERQNNLKTEGLLIDYEHEQVHKIKDGRIKKSKAWKYCLKFYYFIGWNGWPQSLSDMLKHFMYFHLFNASLHTNHKML